MHGSFRLSQTSDLLGYPIRIDLLWKRVRRAVIHLQAPLHPNGTAIGLLATHDEVFAQASEECEQSDISAMRQRRHTLYWTVSGPELRHYTLIPLNQRVMHSGFVLQKCILRCEREVSPPPVVPALVNRPRTAPPGGLRLVTARPRRETFWLKDLRVDAVPKGELPAHQIRNGDDVLADVDILSPQDFLAELAQWDRFSERLRQFATGVHPLLIVTSDLTDLLDMPGAPAKDMRLPLIAVVTAIPHLKLVFAGPVKLASAYLQDFAMALLQASQPDAPPQSDPENVLANEILGHIVGLPEGFRAADIALRMPSVNRLRIRRHLLDLVNKGRLALVGKTDRSGFRLVS